jgi:glycosyltransferase involved in cell wall biosynthesis
MSLNKNLIVVQPALPFYRIPFFQQLSSLLKNNFKLYFSPPSPDLQQISMLQNYQFPHHELPRLSLLFLNFRWQTGLLSIPISRHSSIVCICGAPRDLSTLFLLLKCKIFGVPIVWWGQYWSSTSTYVGLLVRLFLMRICSSILFYTNLEVDRYLSSHPSWLTNQCVSGIDNGANYELVKTLAQPYFFNKRPLAIIFIGRPTLKAQFHLLLEALGLIEDISITVHIIGALESSVFSSENTRHSLLFHGSTVDESMISAYMNSSLLFVYPGSVGLSLVHAMAYGLPSIIHSNRLHHMPEADAASKHTSFFFDEYSSSSLASTIRFALSSPHLCEAKSQASINIIKSRFNINAMSSNFINHLELYHGS